MKITRALVFIIHKIWLTAALLLVTLALLLSLARLLLPYTSQYKNYLVDWVSAQIEQPIAVESLSAGWNATGPVARLQDFSFIVEQSEKTGVQVSIDSVDLELNFWQSLLNQKPIVNNFVLDGVELVIDLQKVNQAQKTGEEIAVLDLLESIFLERFHRFDVTHSYITLISTSGEAHQIKVHQLKWSNQDEQHKSIGEFSLEGLNEDKLAFMIELNGSSESQYDGQFYLKSDGVNLVPWLKPFLNQNVKNLQSKVRFEGWFNIADSRPQDFLLNLEPSEVSWFIGDKSAQLELVSGHLQGAFSEGEARFYLEDLSIAQGDEYWANINLQLRKQKQNWHMYSERLNLQPLKSILPLLDLPAKSGELMSAIGGQPALESVYFSYFNDERWLTRGRLIDLSLKPKMSLPKLDNVTAEFIGDQSFVNVAWQVPEQSVQWPAIYADNEVTLAAQFTTRLKQLGEQNWRFLVQPELFEFNHHAVDFSVVLHNEIERENQLSMFISLPEMALTDVKKLLPEKILGAETYAYLSRSLISGQLAEAQLVFEGPPVDFPFENNHSGKMLARLTLQNSEFEFQPDWPVANDLAMQLTFNNQSLSLTSEQGELLGAKLIKFNANIPDLLDPDITLTIAADVQAEASQATNILLNSSLKTSVGTALEQLNIEGVIKHRLNLMIPLQRSRDLNASGEIWFANNKMTISGPDFELTHINGLLKFDMDELDAKKLSFDWGPVPYQVDLTGQQLDSGYQVDLALSGDWPVDAILAQTGYLKMSDRLKGNAKVEGHLALTFPNEGFSYRLDMVSDLQGVQISLPQPYNKHKDFQRFTRLLVKGDQNISQIELESGENLFFNAVLPHQMARFSRAYLVLGQDLLSQPATGFNIAVYLPQADFSSYLSLLSDITEDSERQQKSSEQPVIDLPERVRGRLGEFSLGPLNWHNTDIDLQRRNDNWQIKLRAEQFDGLITFNTDLYREGIQISAERMRFDPQLSELVEQVPSADDEQEIRDIFNSLPDISLTCRQCQFREKNLGQVDLKLVRTSPQDISLQGFKLNYRGNWVEANGVWRMGANNKSQTRLKGKLHSDDFGWWLRDYQLSSAIRDSRADAEFSFSWPNAPMSLQTGLMNGEVNWRLGEGYLTEVSDKGARLLSLLSLDSLVRKLRLDFRDVFSKGLFYNSLKGDLTIQNGVVHTDNTHMDGVAGNMDIRGSTNLVDETLNYKVKFSPKITSSLPVLIAWMVNPVTGIAALAIDQVIESADVISQIEFVIHGTIDTPKVVETGRESKEIKIPKNKQLKNTKK
ncbi:YhdP family protein [Gayadomonas joobiniege]|uniref:YhdP family protein n=1 Tax=Gayadomonas joobiniege TaxID=1234606 RepID=UPI000366078C|nr:YhdP family protein [Gayadomonas joobiniege]